MLGIRFVIVRREWVRFPTSLLKFCFLPDVVLGIWVCLQIEQEKNKFDVWKPRLPHWNCHNLGHMFHPISVDQPNQLELGKAAEVCTLWYLDAGRFIIYNINARICKTNCPIKYTIWFRGFPATFDYQKTNHGSINPILTFPPCHSRRLKGPHCRFGSRSVNSIVAPQGWPDADAMWGQQTPSQGVPPIGSGTLWWTNIAMENHHF